MHFAKKIGQTSLFHSFSETPPAKKTHLSPCHDVHSHLSLSMSAVSRLWDDTLETPSNLKPSLTHSRDFIANERQGEKRWSRRETNGMKLIYWISTTLSAVSAFFGPCYHHRRECTSVWWRRTCKMQVMHKCKASGLECNMQCEMWKLHNSCERKWTHTGVSPKYAASLGCAELLATFSLFLEV